MRLSLKYVAPPADCLPRCWKRSLHQLIPLELLRAGEEGRVHQIDGERELVVRLEEIGLRHGVDVRMVRPGSPCIVAFDNHRLSVRTDECAVVMVEVQTAAID